MLYLLLGIPGPLVDELVPGQDHPGSHQRQAGEEDLGVAGRGGVVVTRRAVHALQMLLLVLEQITAIEV